MKAYKLFRAKEGKLYPLFVHHNKELPVNVWINAEEGVKTLINNNIKVKSKLGNLAFRPGFHSGDLPIATHIGIKENQKVKYRRYNEVWCEVEISDKINYQKEAYKNGLKKSGKFNSRDADLKYIPVNGYYKYKTNPNMLGKWIISGSIKINKVLTEQEVNNILKDNNIKPMQWENGKLDLKNLGFKIGV